MLNLKESLFIGAIGVSSLFSTGCQIKAVQEILPDPGHEVEVPTITFAENIRVENCVIIHDDPNGVLVLDTSEHPIFKEAEDNVSGARRKYGNRKVTVTGVITDTFTDEVWLEVGEDEERVMVELKDSFSEAQLDAWEHTTKTFTGYIGLIERYSLTIDTAVLEGN